VKITITIEAPDDAVKMFLDMAGALQTIAKTVTVTTEKQVEEVAKEIHKHTKQLDAFKALAEEQKAAERPTKPAYTLEQVRAKLADLQRQGKRAEVKALIQSFGVSKLSEVPADKYAELMAKAEEIA